MADKTDQALLKILKPVHLWAIAVGLVISGEYFGWNYGWAAGGTVGFLIATVLVTILYITFIFSFTELTTSIPNAGGPFAYALKAFGPWGGFIAGYATLIEFLITPPAIAFALGSYVHFLYPSLQMIPVAIGFFFIFILINLLGIRESATFSLVVTVLAVAELLVYLGIIAPHFVSSNFVNDGMPFGWTGVFASLPFAIWFYLAIEGVAMVAEEVYEPEKNIRKGYSYGILTLIMLAFGVMILTGGIADWKQFTTIDYPLPAALAIVTGESNPLTKIFASLGLFGLIASFHGTILGCSRQLYALSREGYLPAFLSRVSQRFRTPYVSIISGGVVGIVALLIGTTDKVIIVAALGAVVMYIISMLSLFKLRKTHPSMARPFKAPFYPVFPAIAVVLCFSCLGSIVCYNFWIATLFFSGLVISAVVFSLIKKENSTDM